MKLYTVATAYSDKNKVTLGSEYTLATSSDEAVGKCIRLLHSTYPGYSNYTATATQIPESIIEALCKD